MNPSIPDDLQERLDTTVAALNALIAGDPAPFNALWSHEPDVTVLGGFGGWAVGLDQVTHNTTWAASRFHGGRNFGVELLATGASGDLAYAIWIERGEMRVAGRDDFAPITIRVTLIFRCENGEWKLIHRHGDPVVDKTEPGNMTRLRQEVMA